MKKMNLKSRTTREWKNKENIKNNNPPKKQSLEIYQQEVKEQKQKSNRTNKLITCITAIILTQQR